MQQTTIRVFSTILTRVVGLGLEPKTTEAEAGKNVEAENSF